MHIFEVNYDFEYSGGHIQNETRHVTTERLKQIFAYQGVRKYYSNVKVIHDFGETDRTYLGTWLRIGLKNSWIRQATDPSSTMDSFYECKTVEHLMDMLDHGNWTLGTAFHFKDLCFINQVNAGDEWLTIRQDVPFESVSCRHIITKDREEFENLVQRMLDASLDDLKALRY